MFYIHQANCISPQQTFGRIDLESLRESVSNQLHALEPDYEGIPRNTIRRMGKAVRMGVGAALPIFQKQKDFDGIIFGTANGGMEDSSTFLKQMIEYNEGLLTPGNFVQSTANAAASQLSLLTGNRGYNCTHVHRGLAFENAATDTAMLLAENKNASYLLGGLDEIASYNHELEFLDGWYNSQPLSNLDLYTKNTAGTIAGEGSAVFLVNNNPLNAVAKMESIYQAHGTVPATISWSLDHWLKKLGNPHIDILLTGENGDERLTAFYSQCEERMNDGTTIARFKHLCGEYPTVTAFAVWLACKIFDGLAIPRHCIKRNPPNKNPSTILIYNNHKNLQHSFILLSKNRG